jgi:protein TonB
MANHPLTLFDLSQAEPRRKSVGPPRVLRAVQNDVSLNALLEEPNRKSSRRNPLEWAGAMGLHIVILAALIIIPLYTTGTIQLSHFDDLPLIAPPPLPAPPAGPPAASPHIVHPRTGFTYATRRLPTPNSIPKRVAQENAGAAAPPELDGVAGGVPGGVVGGELGGLLGGVGTAVPPPTPQPQPTKRIVRVGSGLKAPRQTYNLDPEYPPLARETHIQGTVVVEAVIDEHGNVVQARVVSGHPLLVGAALKAVQQWKYEPSSLNGLPISIVMQVQVHFSLKS